MASIKCGHCKETHTSVADVRACAAASRHPVGVRHNGGTNMGGGENFSSHVELPDPVVGNVVTLHGVSGVYWEVDQVITDTAPGSNWHVVSISKRAPSARWINLGQIDQQWASLQHLADHVVSQPAPAPEQPQTLARVGLLDRPAGNWAAVNALRAEVHALLKRKERGKLVGYFALLDVSDGGPRVKFYRVRSPLQGRWAGKVFIDAQASDEFHPVRAYTATVQVLEGILADPEAASLLYGHELGRCYRCRRTLTDETSRALGIGPECQKKE